MSVVTRVAPSPTGEPHVGTAYVSLFNWAWAKRNGGRFILRTEDTDRARSDTKHEEAIFDALAWLGIEADESSRAGGPSGPYRQSERSAIYREHTNALIASGAAYRCFCTSERLAELREAQKAAKGTFGYDGLCRDIPADESAARAANEQHVVRLRVDKSGSTKFNDLLRGEIEITNDNVDDQVLLKSDGMPTYHMANVVDDHLMGVSIIMRAEEWIPSTPKHVMLYAALGWTPPIYAHVPLLRNADKSKISKRKNPTSILWYREHGFLPEALVNFLALQGWSMGETDDEEFPIEDFVARFDPKDISVGGPVFDMTKLEWVNGEKIRKLSVAELAERLVSEGFAEGWTAERVEQVLPLFRERMKTLLDFQAGARFLLERIEPDLEGLTKKLKKADPEAVSAALLDACKELEAREGQSDDDRENALREIAAKHELKVGALFMGLRVGITGSTASPPLLPSIDALGTGESVARVRALAERMVVTR
ncbi:MAG: glutamate--tRNA ligase [Planctomycetota bacterium]|nr:MAG: glutamate--tRNA ligase [Planctomycetota bacterium]